MDVPFASERIRYSSYDREDKRRMTSTGYASRTKKVHVLTGDVSGSRERDWKREVYMHKACNLVG